jgi:hypothetical protein
MPESAAVQAPGQALTFQPAPAADWDGARTRRFALRTAQAEFTAGCHSVERDGWRFPQIDHAYEGLLALIDGENWMWLDSLGIQVRHQGVVLDLRDAPITVDPISAKVRHESALGTWQLTWTLKPHDGQSGTVLRLEVAPPADLPEGVTLHLLPIFDVRHMYATSAQDDYDVDVLPAGEAVVRHHGRAVVIRSQPEPVLRIKQRRVPLFYRMGSGFRYQAEDGVRFQSEERFGCIVGEWQFAAGAGNCVIEFAVGRDEAEARDLFEVALPAESERPRFDDAARLALRKGGHPGAIERVFVMAQKFGMVSMESRLRLPEAGGWWFRTPWFRDVFEGYLSNWRTLLDLDLKDRIEAACTMAARLIDPISGRVPNRLPERHSDVEHLDTRGRLPDGYYHSVDATTLLFTLLDTVDGRLDLDQELFMSAFRRAAEAFIHARADTPDGTAVLGSDGLLRCVPWHSWTDGKRQVSFGGQTLDDMPIRVPRQWQIEELVAGRTPGEIYRDQLLPTYLLPEINAQWLRMLSWGMRHLPEEDPLRETLGRAQSLAHAAYRPVFWNPSLGYPFNLVRSDGRADDVPGSPGMVAAVLLADSGIFSDADLRQVWDTCRDRLAVRRQGKLFGILVKASDERVYYGDPQYHEAVCWPRDSAYLAVLLAELGEAEAFEDLLLSNLAHQQEEGVLFYNHELFSLPEGRNPAGPSETAEFPVPVKNPMQWWSQWCDPFLYDVRQYRHLAGE